MDVTAVSNDIINSLPQLGVMGAFAWYCLTTLNKTIQANTIAITVFNTKLDVLIDHFTINK